MCGRPSHETQQRIVQVSLGHFLDLYREKHIIQREPDNRANSNRRHQKDDNLREATRAWRELVNRQTNPDQFAILEGTCQREEGSRNAKIGTKVIRTGELDIHLTQGNLGHHDEKDREQGKRGQPC